LDIIVTPSSTFRIASVDSGNDAVRSAFSQSSAHGILELVKHPELRKKSGSASFWIDYADAFLRTLCAFSDTDPLAAPKDIEFLLKHSESVPPMNGAENINHNFLNSLWEQAEKVICDQISNFDGNPRTYIAKEFPKYEGVGKIHFHLAENRKSDVEPFLFLSTYSVRIPGKARIQHRPLGVALKESLSSDNRVHLEQLLSPVFKASKRSTFIQTAIENKSIYIPRGLSPLEAFKFISDIPACEEAGIICKVPNWWQNGRPKRAKVAVQVNAKTKKSHVGFNQLVDFNVGVSVGGKALTKEELQKILDAEGPLVDLGGTWIEVDRERIEKMLSVWDKAVAASYEEGMNFAKAMRLLSGFSNGESSIEGIADDEGQKEWLEVTAGEGFNNLLKDLRAPKQLQAEAVSKVLADYLKGKLRPYQVSGVNWLETITTLQLGGCLADDMGLGKTIQILSMLLVQKHYHKVKSLNLLVLPASLLGNWIKEIEKFSPSLKYLIVHSSAGASEALRGRPDNLQKYDVVLTTYGMILRTEWLQTEEWETIIADEAQAIKNSKTKQSKAMRELTAKTKIAMTGTPVENNLTDLWSIFDFSCPGLLGTNSQFKSAIKKMASGGSDGSSDYGSLRSLISPYLIRRKKTDKTVIADLPDKIEMTATSFLTSKQASLYNGEVERLKKSLEGADGIQRKGLVLASLMKFKQICNHPSQYQSNDSYEPKLSGKFTKLAELVETISSRGEKVLVFTQFREMTDIISHFLGDCFGSKGLILHGGTPVKKRQDLVDQFQDPNGPSFFVLSLKAGGTGLNLTEASHVIHFDRWWNPAVENQATDRAFRIGQRRNVVVHKFMCRGTIEEKIDNMIREKQGLSDAMFEGSKEMNLTELSDQDLLDMVRLDINALDDV
jgi:hypothetical protein